MLDPLDAELSSYERDETLLLDDNLAARARALDFVAFVGEVARVRPDEPRVATLARRAEMLRARLTAIDERLIGRVRKWIRSEHPSPAAVRRELDHYTAYRPDQPTQPHYGFDGLDVLIAGLMGSTARPAETRESEREMIHYEPSPARVILDLVDDACLRPDDVFYDLGSGLGFAVVLIRLVSGIVARGVEYQQSYVDAARRGAESLGLTGIDFSCADVRESNLADGTVFYLFTPFRGQLMHDVLGRLRALAANRPITICTFGSCTHVVAAESWLNIDDPDRLHDYKLAVFRSR